MDTRIAQLELEFIGVGVCSCDGEKIIEFNFPNGHPDYGRIIPCICITTPPATDRKDLLARASNLNNFEKRTFQGFIPGWNSGCQYAYEQTIAWSKAENEQFLTLYGATGVGKTHLAIAAAYGCIDRNEAVLFFQSSDLIRNLQSGIKSGESEKLISELKSISNLVIDDLGREYTTNWTIGIFHELIDHSYRNDQLRTLVTTNHSLKELYDIVGVPVVSRLTDSHKGNLVVMDGTDVRPRLLELRKNGTK